MNPILAYEMFCEGFSTFDIAEHVGASEAEVEAALHERRLGRRLVSEYMEAVREGFYPGQAMEIRPQA